MVKYVDAKNIRVPLVTVAILVAFVTVHTVVVYAGVTRMIDVAISKHLEHPHPQSLTGKDAELLVQEIQALRRDIDRLEKRLDN